jgi:hypothetical protein
MRQQRGDLNASMAVQATASAGGRFKARLLKIFTALASLNTQKGSSAEMQPS